MFVKSVIFLSFLGVSLGAVADPETTTPHGCTCTSVCGASVGDGFSTDWCYTADSCGEYTLALGYWDYCLYLDSSKPDYVAMDWKDKQAYLWGEVKADNTMGKYYATDLPTESVKTSFDDEWDVMPEGRHKVIHSVGAVCPFQIDIAADSPYTGLLKAGANVHGLIRMGPATDPYSFGKGKDLVPGVGVKFLRTGVSSANFMLLHSLDPLANNNFNFFAEPVSNHLSGTFDSISLKVLAQKFCQTGYCLGKVGISHLTTHDQDGNTVEEPNFPFKFSFTAADVSFPEAPPNSFNDFVGQFTALPVGTTLYNVMAHSSPDDAGSLLGQVVTTDNCVTSKFGDSKLFFRHKPIEEDQALRPEWTDGYQADCGTDQCF